MISCSKKQEVQSAGGTVEEPVPSRTEFVEVKDTVYYFIKDGIDIVDTIITVIKEYSHTIQIGVAPADTLTVAQQRLEIVGKKVDWDKTDFSLRIFDRSRVYYSKRAYVPPPQPITGFGEEYQTGVGIVRYKDHSLIEMISSVAPSLPGDDSYMYYVFSHNDTLVQLDGSLNIFINKIQSQNDAYFSEFTDGCVTVTVPIEIDFSRHSIYVPFKDSAIFPVKWFTLTVGSEENFDPAEPRSNIRVFIEPSAAAQYSTEQVHTVKEIEFIKQYYPEYAQGEYKNVWTYIRIGKKYGWIHGEDRLKLGVDYCG
ncbi:MAG: hypothetical protein KA247_01770 [Bacteroidetes bacterium]|nr:hypothetical protein [Bacteroidota bacterium]